MDEMVLKQLQMRIEDLTQELDRFQRENQEKVLYSFQLPESFDRPWSFPWISPAQSQGTIVLSNDIK
jgi:hypothetical protein